MLFDKLDSRFTGFKLTDMGSRFNSADNFCSEAQAFIMKIPYVAWIIIYDDGWTDTTNILFVHFKH